MMEIILYIAIGTLFGCIISNLLRFIFCGSGKLQIFHGEEKDTYNFAVDKLDDLNKKKRFVLKVEHFPR